MLNRTKLTGIVLGAALLLCNPGTAKADHWNDGKCRSRIQKEQRALERAECRYGPGSRQANEERFELQRLLNRCGYYQDDRRGNHYWDRDRDDRWRNYDRDRDEDRWRH